MRDKKLLVAGVSGFVGQALALELCGKNEVYGLARFRDERLKKHLESKGVICIAKDVSEQSLNDLPADFDYVFNNLKDNIRTGLVAHGEGQREALELNASFVGRLMSHCRRARAFIQTSTAAVYPWSPAGRRWKETDGVGPQDAYGVSKFAGEAVATFASLEWGIPTCILRLAYPYNEEGGLLYVLANWIADRQTIKVKMHQDRGYNPIHLSDFVRYSILSVDHGTVPPRVINACGADAVAQLELLRRIGKALGVEPIIGEVDASRIGYLEPTWVLDPTLLIDLMGQPSITLEEGIRRVVNKIHELKRRSVA